MRLRYLFSRMEDISMSRADKRRVLMVMAALLIIVVSLCGCRNEIFEMTVRGYTFRFTAGSLDSSVMRGEDVCLTEGQIRLLLSGVRNGYEEALTDDIWNMQLEGSSFAEYVDETVLDMAARLIIVNMLAQEKRIELSAEESGECKDRAHLFYVENEEELDYISSDEVDELFVMMRLSDKVYDELTRNVNTEISVDEARIIRIQYIYSKDSMKRLQNALDEYNEGAAFDTLAEKYSDSEEYIAEIGRGELESNFEEAAFNLDAGQVSEIVSCNNGFYLIYCVDDNMAGKAEGQAERIIQRRREEQFAGFYNDFSKNIVLSFDKRAWRKIIEAEEKSP